MEPTSDTLRIRVADSPDSSLNILEVDRSILQCWSSCAKGLPATADEWDVSQLLIEGQPVQRETVVAWLNALYDIVYGKPFEQQEKSPVHNITGLAQLLAFADAVGSSRGVLRALDARMSADSLVAVVDIGDTEVILSCNCCYYFSDATALPLTCLSPGQQASACRPRTAAVANSAEDKARFCLQFAQQLEMLLFLAFKLQMTQLQQVLQTCISNNSCWTDSVLNTPAALDAIMSARMLSAGVTPGCQSLRDAFITRSSAQLCAFAGGSGRQQLLKPLGLSAEQQQPLTFKAEALADFYCYRKGQVLKVELDLFGVSYMRLTLDGRVNDNAARGAPCTGAALAVAASRGGSGSA